MSAEPAVAAVVFDFDGTIVDTETPVYESWRVTFEHAGVEPVDRGVWVAQIGKSDGEAMDVRKVLCEQLGVNEVPAELEAMRRQSRDDILAALPVREGVVDWIEAANAAGVALAVASSSSTEWVDSNLRERGLRHHFVGLSCADPGIPGKPDPTVYRSACELLEVEPAAALAIEDSSNGVRAAIDAGMRCLAVPGPMTRTADFGHATAHAMSLADFSPADWGVS